MSTSGASGPSNVPPDDPIGLGNDRRLALVLDYPIDEIVAPPGHRALRNPSVLHEMAAAIRDGDDTVRREPMRLNVWPRDVEDGLVRAWSVHCVDGTHRLVAGASSGIWKCIRDVLSSGIEVRMWMEGMNAADPPQARVRWIPREVAEASRIDDWVDVTGHELARGPTAQIRADIANDSLRFHRDHRGVSIERVLKANI